MLPVFEEVPADTAAQAQPGTADARLSLHVLASGSHGNSSVIVDGRTGRAVVIDAGICKRDFVTRCEEAGVRTADIDGIFITHEHGDHTKGLGVLLRGFAKDGIEVPVYISDEVRKASSFARDLAKTFDLRAFEAGREIDCAGMTVHPFATLHDSVESFGFRIEGADGDAVGFMTDTGVVTEEAHACLKRCRILAIESNHDLDMLMNGPYPYVIKRRIASESGHLSNEQSADLLEQLLCDELETVVAMHISENNNTYRLPEEILSAAVARNGHPARVHVAYQAMRVSVR